MGMGTTTAIVCSSRGRSSLRLRVLLDTWLKLRLFQVKIPFHPAPALITELALVV